MGGKEQKFRVKRGEIVHPWGSTIGICTTDTYRDQSEREKQAAYWIQKRGIDLGKEGELVRVVFLAIDDEGNLSLGDGEYIFPMEVIKFRGVEKFKKRLNELRKDK